MVSTDASSCRTPRGAARVDRATEHRQQCRDHVQTLAMASARFAACDTDKVASWQVCPTQTVLTRRTLRPLAVVRTARWHGYRLRLWPAGQTPLRARSVQSSSPD